MGITAREKKQRYGKQSNEVGTNNSRSSDQGKAQRESGIGIKFSLCY